MIKNHEKIKCYHRINHSYSFENVSSLRNLNWFKKYQLNRIPWSYWKSRFGRISRFNWLLDLVEYHVCKHACLKNLNSVESHDPLGKLKKHFLSGFHDLSENGLLLGNLDFVLCLFKNFNSVVIQELFENLDLIGKNVLIWNLDLVKNNDLSENLGLVENHDLLKNCDLLFSYYFRKSRLILKSSFDWKSRTWKSQMNRNSVLLNLIDQNTSIFSIQMSIRIEWLTVWPQETVWLFAALLISFFLTLLWIFPISDFS